MKIDGLVKFIFKSEFKVIFLFVYFAAIFIEVYKPRTCFPKSEYLNKAFISFLFFNFPSRETLKIWAMDVFNYIKLVIGNTELTTVVFSFHWNKCPFFYTYIHIQLKRYLLLTKLTCLATEIYASWGKNLLLIRPW